MTAAPVSAGRRWSPDRRWLPLAAVAVVVAAFGAVIQGADSFLGRHGVVATPARYVALAVDPRGLPDKVGAGEALPFVFSVSSTFPQPVDQPWTVRVTEPGAPAASVQGRVTVGPRGTARVPVTVTLSAIPGTATVTVVADGQPLAPLQFRVNVVSSAAPGSAGHGAGGPAAGSA